MSEQQTISGSLELIAVDKREYEALKVENADLKLRLLSAAGDDLCRLTQEEIKAYASGAVSHQRTYQRIKLLTAVRNALGEYEVKRGRELHMEPRGITQRHVQEFAEAIEARMNEGGS
jgi:hypothetical protein